MMKIKFVVMSYRKNGEDKEIKRFDTYEQAEKCIMDTSADVMGTAEFYILKIWTNT